MDEPCDLIVEALDLTRGDAVFEKGGDVETVMDNLRTGQLLAQDEAVGSVAITANGTDRGFLLVGEKGFETLLLLPSAMCSSSPVKPLRTTVT